MLFHPADREAGRRFFDEFWPEARAVSDPEGVVYDSLGLSRATLRQLFGPGVWVKALKAVRGGNSYSLPVGNPWLLPGILLVLDDQILWQWEFRNIGDHPDFLELSSLSRQLTSEQRSKIER